MFRIVFRHLLPFAVCGLTFTPLSAQQYDDEAQEAVINEKDELDVDEGVSVGEAVKRRTDLDFQNVLIDGQESDLSLDELPSDAVGRAEVLKAVLPDMDADSRGGSLSIWSRPNFNLPGPDIKARIIAKYHEIFDEVEVDSNFTAGMPLGHEGRYGLRVGISTDQFLWGNQYIEQTWRTATLGNESIQAPSRLDFTSSRQVYDEIQVDATFDAKISDHFNIYIKGNGASYEGQNTIQRYQLRFNPPSVLDPDNVTQGGYHFEEAMVDRGVTYYEMEQDRYEWSTGGFYDLDLWHVDYSYRAARIDYREPVSSAIDYVREAVELDYDLSDSTFPTFTFARPGIETEYGAFQFENLNYKTTSRDRIESSAFANVKRDFSLSGGKGFIKFGAKWRSRELDQFSGNRIYNSYDGTHTLADVLGTYESDDFLEGRYTLSGLPDPGQSIGFYNANESAFVLNERRTRENADPGTFDVTEALGAGYLMGSYEIGAFRFLTGYRIEETMIDFQGHEVVIDSDGNYQQTNVVEGSRTYQNGFPALYVRYKLSPWATLIGSVTETVKRAEFQELAPSRSIDFQTYEVTEGNPDLRPTLYTNYDASVEFRIGDSGLLTVEGYFREVEDLVFTQRALIDSGNYAGYWRTRLENSGSGEIAGLLLTWDQELDAIGFLPEGFAYNTQFRYQKSSVTYPGRPGEDDLPLANTPELLWDLTLRYQTQRLYSHIRFAYAGSELVRIGGSALRDRYNKSSVSLDLNTNWKISKNWSVDLEWNKILDTPGLDAYEGEESRGSAYRRWGWNVQASLRWQL